MDQQIKFAEGFRNMTDMLKEKLRHLQQDKALQGKDTIVSEQDMHMIINDLRQAAAGAAPP